MVEVNSPEDAKIILQKLPSDMGIHRNPRKGTLSAPEEILEDFSTEKDILVEEIFPDEFSLENTQDRIEENTEELLEYGKPVVSLGGDHSVSFPVLRALKEENPDLKLVWLDAHLDLKQKVDGHVSHDVVVRELLENGFSEDEIFFVGVTRIDEDEEEFLDGRDMKIYRPGEVEEFKREFKKDEHPVYLSVDIDVLEESLAPGTGYPDGEMRVSEVLDVVEAVEPDHADLVEVGPVLDSEDTTVENAREILLKLLQVTG
jgi:arginase family enzyme